LKPGPPVYETEVPNTLTRCLVELMCVIITEVTMEKVAKKNWKLNTEIKLDIPDLYLVQPVEICYFKCSHFW
jgi:hypothetical protein